MRNLVKVALGDETRLSEERAARNEVFFREANEKLGDKRQTLDLDGATPFLCECGNPACTELVQLSAEEYDHVRSRPNRFLIVHGHSEHGAETVETHDGYVIVEKFGVAGRIAEEADPRR